MTARQILKTMKMKRSYSSPSYGPMVVAIILALAVAAAVFFYLQLRSMDNRMTKLEAQITDSMQKSDAVVNFLQSAIQAQQKK